MEEYKDISRGLKMLLDKAEEMGGNWETYILERKPPLIGLITLYKKLS